MRAASSQSMPVRSGTHAARKSAMGRTLPQCYDMRSLSRGSDSLALPVVAQRSSPADDRSRTPQADPHRTPRVSVLDALPGGSGHRLQAWSRGLILAHWAVRSESGRTPLLVALTREGD